MFITSEHQPLGFVQCARIDYRNRRCRSGRHEDYQAFRAAIIADYVAEHRLSLSPASKLEPTLGVWVQVMLTSVTSPTIEVIPVGLHRVDPGGLSGHLDDGEFERLGRYEAALCRQIVQTLFVLRSSRFQVHTDFSSTVLKARRPRPCIFGPRIPEIQIYGILRGSTA
jgi:hypothetical protein